MTTVQNHQQSYAPLPDDIYDPDDVVFPGSPPLQPLKVNVRPSPTPPFMVPIPPSPLDINSGSPSGTSRRKEARRPKIAPSQSDAGLVGIMADGRAPDIAWRAGNELLAADPDDDDDPAMNGSNHVEVEVEVDEVGMGTETGVGGEVGGEAVRGGECDSARTEREKEAMENDGLALVAAQAVDALMKAQGASPPQKQIAMSKSPRGGGELADEARSAISPIPPRTAAHLDGSRSPLSPESAAQSDVQTSAAGELPPIRQLSSNTGLINGSGGPITLPSITAQLGDINHLPEPPSAGESPYAQSPPARPPPLFAAAPSHGSPPKSPNDTFRRELPSPGRAPFFNYNNAHRRPSQSEAIHYSSAGDYSSANTETPSTDQSGATPAIDRMSIDGITNPQIGGFQCTHPGCTAQPFQTQYLLNSHTNVHSQNRPHYCTVKGCPRSEGGKGFKRKNEMIRHGLVHDSPGYVCPFCPDREHKYPRPDNLQRHVRVHHLDKDKDDPQLRDVLAQRPEGPSRGRRRRGGTS